MKSLLSFCVFLYFLHNVIGQIRPSFEGYTCTTKDKDVSGLCKKRSDCLEELAGQKINICGYSDQEPVVCCPKSTRLCVKKCQEYKKYSAVLVSITGLPFERDSMPVAVSKCDSELPVIVGGEITKVGEFPHMAAIGWGLKGNYRFECGGSLISEYFVLTAAHCSEDGYGESPTIVRLGEQNLFKDDDGAKPVDYLLVEFIKHPDYRTRTHYNDIALIKLGLEVKFSTSIRPACIWPSKTFPVTKAVAVGFGLTSYYGQQSDNLLKVALDIYNNSDCQVAYLNSRKLPNGIIDTQICSGFREGGKDTCQGDSGGPLQLILDSNLCVHYLVGVTSIGKVCGSKDTPGIYTKIFSYVDWIEITVWG